MRPSEERLIKKKSAGLSCLFLLALSCACSSGGGDANPPPEPAKDDPSLAADIQPIFTSSCALAACHNGSAQAGLVLLPGQAFANLVGVQSSQAPSFTRVLPGDPQNSYIVIKVEGRQTVGVRMPATGSISAIDIQNIRNWIARGAQNN